MEMALLNVGRPGRPRPGPVPGLLRRPDGPDLPGLRPRARRPRVRVGPGRDAARARRTAEGQELQRRRLHPCRHGHGSLRPGRGVWPGPGEDGRPVRRRRRLRHRRHPGADGRLGHRRRPDRGPEMPGRAARPVDPRPVPAGHGEAPAAWPPVPAYYSDLLRWLPVMRDPTKYFSTPCVNEIRAFAEGTRIIVEEGLDDRFERHELLCRGHPGRPGRPRLRLLHRARISSPRPLSVVRYPDGLDDPAFRAGLTANGVVVAGGLGPTAGRVFRMGHMGNLTSAQVRFAIERRGEDARPAWAATVAPGVRTPGGRRRPQGPLEGRAPRMKSTGPFHRRRFRRTRRGPGREGQAGLPGHGLQRAASPRTISPPSRSISARSATPATSSRQWLVKLIWEVRQRTAHAFLTDSNTLYVGHRSNSIDHLRLAWSHGFTPEITGLPVIIADGLIGRDKHGAAERPGPDGVLEDRQRHPRRRRPRRP
ncbi:MAG: hypothetical protein M0C28_35785 [Candidatus Moduliflexus flocculans]|nr:hypothetical protein [Candidatus Moduliflexus flocculans]